MDILPLKHSQFKSKNYWDSFFSKLKGTKDEYFQWYGDYRDHRGLLQPIMQSASNVFHVGCGKSIFAEDLHADFPDAHIVSCDYSQQIIEEMQARTAKLKLSNLSYQVVDLLKPVNPQHQSKFDVVIDKGTLDAMLPEDTEENCNNMHSCYFPHIEASLKKGPGSTIVIISLLQPFVLRTLLEHYWDSEFSIELYQSLLKESKLQPYLVKLTHSQNKQKMSTLHLLGEKQAIKLQSIKAVLDTIKQRQDEVYLSDSNKKKLEPGQRTKFNIYNQDANKSLRYIVEILDAEDREVLALNKCSVFIVPRGRENTYVFNTDEGLKELVQQVKSSRVILAKMVAGNRYDNLEQVKTELNSIIPDLIQQGCRVDQVPYLTDADSLGTSERLFDNEEFVIDEVLVSQEAYRRLFLKSNIKVPQCQSKLTVLSTNNPVYALAKDVHSKILPTKKGMFTGIQRLILKDDNAQSIYAGLSCFLGHPKVSKSKILIFGAQVALAKFMVEYLQGVQITLVTTQKTIKEVCRKYFELAESEAFQIFIASPSDFLVQHPEWLYDAIILADNSSEEGPNPGPTCLSEEFLHTITKHLIPPGIFILQLWEQQKLPSLRNHFYPVYANNSTSASENILFGLRHTPNYKQEADGSVLIVPETFVKPTPKCSKVQYEWETEYFQDLQMVEPNLSNKTENIRVSQQIPTENPYESESQNKKKKKKKK